MEKSKKVRRIIILFVVGVGLLVGLTTLPKVGKKTLLTATANRLFKNPEPIPLFIALLTPFPGTVYPADFMSQPKDLDFGFYASDSICIRINARRIFPDAHDNFDAQARFAPFSSEENYVTLYFDRELVSINNYPWQTSYGEILDPEFVLAQLSDNPIETATDTNFLGVDFCWKLEFSQGVHLAEITIEAADGEILRYQWAFKVRE